ncbi:MAG: HAMP domain-containing protein, partial [Ferrovibrio sp.]
MRIRASFLLFIAVIGFILLGQSGQVVYDAYRERQNAITARGLAATQGELLRLVEQIGIERGAYNAALLEEKVGNLNADALAKSRKTVDDTLVAALTAGRASGHPSIDIRRIDAMKTAVEDWRHRAGAEIVKPKAGRVEDVVRGYSPAMIKLGADIIPMLNAIGAAISRADDDVSSPMELARLAADMRAEASVRGTATVNVVASGKPMPPATSILMAEQSGKVDAIWARIVMTLESLDSSAELKAAAEATRKAFYEGLPALYTAIRTASDKGDPYPFTMADYRAKQSPLLYKAGDLRDAAIKDALRVADMLTAERNRLMIIDLVVAGIAVGLLALGAFFVLRRVITPLADMTATMTRIAEGQTAEIGYADRTDEVGDMAKALGIFQRNADEKTRLETEQRSRADVERSRMVEQRESETAISRE